MLLTLAAFAVAGAAPASWRAIITARDKTRLHNWRTAWTIALERARAGGAARQVAAEGVLLTPDAALEGPGPPPGDYRCRVIKLGAQTPGGLDFVSYQNFRCRIADGSFTKLDGSQRPTGRLYAYDDARQLMLGTMSLGDERGTLPYARDPDRDVVGMVERIGVRRWRIVLPYPRWESLLDVIELVPAEP